MGNHLYKAYVNGKEVKLTHILKNKDRIMIIQKETSHPHETWLKHVTTQQAKRYITKYLNKKDY
jgi:(p)ppGpp synthase/HD superfamily hydrolase